MTVFTYNRITTRWGLIMTDAEQGEAARQFVNKWQKGGDEIRDCHPFWVQLLQNVLGVENATDYISFEKP
jgi:hypothetical protein